jgi:hypothetical protein
MDRICRMSHGKAPANHPVDLSLEGFAAEPRTATAEGLSCRGQRQRQDVVCTAVDAGASRMNRIVVV